MIFVNFKTFEEGSGEKAVSLVKIIEEVATGAQIKIIPVVQIIDAEKIANITKLEVWIQHVDPVSYGAHTGWTLPEEAVRAGVSGVFLNHSEHKFQNYEDLAKAHNICIQANLKTLIFAGDIPELQKITPLKPTYVSYEPAELIGSKTTSVAEAQPEVISQAVGVAKEAGIPLIVGAGIHSREDVKKSLELGAVGVAVATDIVRAVDPKAELLDLIGGFE